MTHRLRLLPHAALALCLALAACAGGDEEPAPPPQSFPRLQFDYLTKLRLRAGSIEVTDQHVPLGPSDVAAQSPVPPAQALADMARARLFAAGLTGRAVFSIDQASIIRAGNGELDGQLLVHLEIFGADGSRAGFAQARVAKVVPPGAPGDLRSNLYGLTRDMLDSMNVELEFQLRHDLAGYLDTGTAVPAAVTAQPLDAAPAPPATPDAGTVPTPPPAGTVPPASDAPPQGASLGPPPETPPPAPPPEQMSPPPGFLQLPPGTPPN
jgi:hypothetical protein